MTDGHDADLTMTPATLKDLQALGTGLLEEFDKYCQDHNLEYFLDAGTLLGAFRGGGWIPWDDDVDVLMFRDAYEELVARWPQASVEGTKLSDPVANPSAITVLPRIQVLGTELVFDERYGICMPERQRVCLDIYILDRAPRHMVKLWLASSRLTQGLLAFRATTPRRVMSTTPVGLEGVAALAICTLSHAIPRIWQQRIYRRLATAGRRSTSTTWFALNHGSPYRHLPIPERMLATTHVAFEGRDYPAPVASEYLALQYGEDFMEPPPTEQRGGHGFKGARIRWAGAPRWMKRSR